MSDVESSRPGSPTSSTHRMSMADEGLHDHRNQPSSLPIRGSDNSNANKAYFNHLKQSFDTDGEPDDDDPEHAAGITIQTALHPNQTGPIKRGRSRSRSFSDQVKMLVHPKERPNNPNTSETVGGILLNVGRRTSIGGKTGLFRTRSNAIEGSDEEDDLKRARTRRPSRSSIDSDVVSHGSRTSQETEEDVCFPMVPEHVRIKGIDFDEIEEFIAEQREENMLMAKQQALSAERNASRFVGKGEAMNSQSSSRRFSSAAMKYTPKNILKRTNTLLRTKSAVVSGSGDIQPPIILKDESDQEKIHNSDSSTVTQDSTVSSDNVKFGQTRIENAAPPDRFSFFCSESDETVHAPDIPSLVEPGQTVKELFRNGDGTWWLDCICPTDIEMKMLAKAFGIHPLTTEDIRMQETREKVELFQTYYFVCFHTFEPDKESEDFLEPINVYVVVFKEGVLTFHFSPISHPANVRRRVRQLRDYVDVSADWLCYALIDDITDEFAPIISAIEHEADAIEDSVFVARDMDFSNMLQRIGESRRKVMTLMRLLSGKADVIKMFAKRCQDEANGSHLHGGHLQSHANLASLTAFGNISHTGVPGGAIAQPRADIALYLGDIQDHVVTMFQNLLAYEKIFSRSHANYLAQLQVESFNSNNKVTELLSKVTLIGTMLVPLNIVTGLFGMNVTVPGEQTGHLYWFFGILGFVFLVIILAFMFAKFWMQRIGIGANNASPGSAMRSIRSFRLKTRSRSGARSVLSFPSRLNRFDD